MSLVIKGGPEHTYGTHCIADYTQMTAFDAKATKAVNKAAMESCLVPEAFSLAQGETLEQIACPSFPDMLLWKQEER